MLSYSTMYITFNDVFTKENMIQAAIQVKSKHGCSGIDNMEAKEAVKYIRDNFWKIRNKLWIEEYIPKEVIRIDIPKQNGKIRTLCINAVLDRIIQKCIVNSIYDLFDIGMSDSSYAYRYERNTKQAVLKLLEYANQGYDYVISIDLENFFNEISHDYVMNLIEDKIKDRKLLRLIRKYLRTTYIENDIRIRSQKGTPQGSNLSPLLSNIMLNELDQEVFKRDNKSIRYADDITIVAKSIKAADRISKSISGYIKNTLKLKVNVDKSYITNINGYETLGFKFYRNNGLVRLKITQCKIDALKDKIKDILNSKNLIKSVMKINEIINSWVNEYSIADIGGVTRDLDLWIHKELVRKCKKDGLKNIDLYQIKIKSCHELWSKARKRHRYDNS